MRRTRLIPLILFAVAALPAWGGPSLSHLPPAARAGNTLPVILAQSTEGGYTSGGNSNEGSGTGESGNDRDPAQAPPPPGTPADAVGITPEATKAIVAQIAEATRYCQDHYDPGYIPDCVAKAYKRIGASLPWRGGYAGARNALIKGGEALGQWVENNRDTTKKPKSGRTGRRAPAERLTAVRPEADRAAAAAIIQDTTLVLLRSTSGSEQRRTAFTQIANVVGTSVVLLRSSRRRRRRTPDQRPAAPFAEHHGAAAGRAPSGG